VSDRSERRLRFTVIIPAWHDAENLAALLLEEFFRTIDLSIYHEQLDDLAQRSARLAGA
jgi:hypothetical protein